MRASSRRRKLYGLSCTASQLAGLQLSASRKLLSVSGMQSVPDYVVSVVNSACGDKPATPILRFLNVSSAAQKRPLPALRAQREGIPAFAPYNMSGWLRDHQGEGLLEFEETVTLVVARCLQSFVFIYSTRDRSQKARWSSIA
jgi:hypothetical protein